MSYPFTCQGRYVPLQGRYVLIFVLWWGSTDYTASKWLNWKWPKPRLFLWCYSVTYSASQYFSAHSRNVYSGKYWINMCSVAQIKSMKKAPMNISRLWIEIFPFHACMIWKRTFPVFSAILTHVSGGKAKWIHWNFHLTGNLWLRKLEPQNTTDTFLWFVMSEPCWIIWMQAGMGAALLRPTPGFLQYTWERYY